MIAYVSPVGWDDSFDCSECGFDPCRCESTQPPTVEDQPQPTDGAPTPETGGAR